ncbi:MAG: Spy/CpxP family protein refolding chaperone [Gemmatimonadota bacterium]
MKRQRISMGLSLFALLALPAVGLTQEHHPQGQQKVERQGVQGMRGVQGMEGMEGMMEVDMPCPMKMSGMMGVGTGKGGMQMGRGTGMMGTMGPSAAMILKQKEALELTDSQVQRLEEIQKESAEARGARTARVSALREQLMEVQNGDDPDLSRVESLLTDLADLHVQACMRSLRSGQRAMEVLTPEQRPKVRYGMRMMREMMSECRQMDDDASGMMGDAPQP